MIFSTTGEPVKEEGEEEEMIKNKLYCGSCGKVLEYCSCKVCDVCGKRGVLCICNPAAVSQADNLDRAQDSYCSTCTLYNNKYGGFTLQNCDGRFMAAPLVHGKVCHQKIDKNDVSPCVGCDNYIDVHPNVDDVSELNCKVHYLSSPVKPGKVCERRVTTGCSERDRSGCFTTNNLKPQRLNAPMEIPCHDCDNYLNLYNYVTTLNCKKNLESPSGVVCEEMIEVGKVIPETDEAILMEEYNEIFKVVTDDDVERKLLPSEIEEFDYCSEIDDVMAPVILSICVEYMDLKKTIHNSMYTFVGDGDGISRMICLLSIGCDNCDIASYGPENFIGRIYNSIKDELETVGDTVIPSNIRILDIKIGADGKMVEYELK